jgi:hypothetical protein
LNEHCTGCHGSEKHKGKIRLHEIGADFSDGASPALWEQVLEQLEIGEMLSEDEGQPTAHDREKIVSWITDSLIAAGKEYEISCRTPFPFRWFHHDPPIAFPFQPAVCLFFSLC